MNPGSDSRGMGALQQELGNTFLNSHVLTEVNANYYFVKLLRFSRSVLLIILAEVLNTTFQNIDEKG